MSDVLRIMMASMKYGVVLLLVGILILTGVTVSGNIGSTALSEMRQEERYLQAYELSTEINATNDDELKGIVSYGSGTELDPYVIHGLNITSDDTAIAISNTTSFLVIRQCLLDSITYESGHAGVELVSHGILLWNVTNCIVEECIIMFRELGLRVWESRNCMVNRNTIYNNSWWGLYVGYSNNIEVSGNHIYNNGESGIRVLCSPGCYVSENIIHDNVPIDWRAGISLWNSSDSRVHNNTIFRQCQGIEFYYVSNANVSRNLVYDCVMGIALYFINDSLVTGNTVHDNIRWGIYASHDSHRNTIYSNVLYDNGLSGTPSSNWGNGYDWSHTASNQWDNDIDTGNYWGDYDGVGEYDVGEVNDTYPLGILPVVSRPADIEFTVDDLGHSITWRTSALEPQRLEIRDNGTLIHASTWQGGDVYLYLGTLREGIHDIELTVYDTHGHSASDHVQVIIHGTTPTTTPTDTMPFILQLAGVLVLGLAATLLAIVWFTKTRTSRREPQG